MKTVRIGSTITILIRSRKQPAYQSKVDADPDTGVKIQVENLSGDVILAYTAMTKSSIGFYYYYLVVASASYSSGIEYLIRVKADDTTYPGYLLEKVFVAKS